LNSLQKNIVLWVVAAVVLLLVYNLFSQPQGSGQESIVFSDFIDHVNKGQIREVTVQGNNISGTLGSGKSFRTYSPDNPILFSMLREKDVRVTARASDDSSLYMTIFISWFPMLLLIAVWIFFMRQMQSGGGKAMAFGKSRANLMTDKSINITFDDVAGIDEAKAELEEVIHFLKEPKKFTRLGGRIPKGLLLVGQPGTGKTLLAKAIAGEAGVPFLSISGSDFVEMFVGVGASRVRDLFVQGKKHAPCIVFIDEIDAVGRHRGAGLGGGHDEREQTLNQLLVEMDGFESNEGVILISATNRPDVLDPALTRPGRFDRQVIVPLPDVKGREKILEVHTKKTILDDDIELSLIARGTPGFSGADIENLVNEAVLSAARQDKEKVAMVDFEFAKDKVLMGPERKSMVISEAERKNTAYHEAGHALVARLLPGSDPIHKVTIIPRGMALGVTQQLPIDEKHTYSRRDLLNRISMLLGGRAAEELILDDFTTGAGNDIERATNLARKMVCEWGMSDQMGPLSYGKKDEQVFLGREFAVQKNYSEETAKSIDSEISQIVSECYEHAKKLLSDNMDILHSISQTLLDRETINTDELDQIIAGTYSPPAPDKVVYAEVASIKAVLDEAVSMEESNEPEPG